MTRSIWLPIKYRGFYDVPRMFEVQDAGSVFLFDCRFDEAADDYGQDYVVYRMAAEIGTGVDDNDWSLLPNRGARIGTVRVADVRFDETKRKFIDSGILGQFKP